MAKTSPPQYLTYERGKFRNSNSPHRSHLPILSVPSIPVSPIAIPRYRYPYRRDYGGGGGGIPNLWNLIVTTSINTKFHFFNPKSITDFS